MKSKFGWQRPEIQPGMTGIQQAIAVKKMQKRADKVDMIAAGVTLAEAREAMMKQFLGD